MTSTPRLLLLIAFAAALGGCLPAAGGGTARFTALNSQEIVLSPYYLSERNAGGDHAWYLTRTVSDKLPIAGFLKPNQMLAEGFARWLQISGQAAAGSLRLGAGEPIQGCSGDLSGEMTQSAGGSFSGRLRFNGYSDDCSMNFDGEVPFQGRIDTTGNSLEVRLSLAELQGRIGQRTLRLGGEQKLSFAATPEGRHLLQAESTLSLADAAGPRYSLAPMHFTWDRRGTYPQVTMEGRVRFVPYGVVELKTTSPIQLSPNRGLPFDGAIRVFGADDSWVRMLFAKPALPGFFRIDGSDGLENMGQL